MKQVIEIIGKTLSIDPSRITAESHLVDHLGADNFERHFTLDRTWKGTDHAASLEPQGLKKLIRDLNAARESLTPRTKGILEVEKHNRAFHKYSEK